MVRAYLKYSVYRCFCRSKRITVDWRNVPHQYLSWRKSIDGWRSSLPFGKKRFSPTPAFLAVFGFAHEAKCTASVWRGVSKPWMANENGEWLCGLWWIKLSMAIGDMKNTWAKGESIITVGSNTTLPYHVRPIKIGHVLTSFSQSHYFPLPLNEQYVLQFIAHMGIGVKFTTPILLWKVSLELEGSRVIWHKGLRELGGCFFFWETGGCCWYAYSTSSYLIHIQPFNKVQTMILKTNTVKE